MTEFFYLLFQIFMLFLYENWKTLVSRFHYSSVVFRMQRKKTVWTKTWMGLLNTHLKHLRNRETARPSIPVLTLQSYYPQSPILRGIVPNQKWRFYTPQMMGREIDQNFFCGGEGGGGGVNFHTRTTLTFDQATKKFCHIHLKPWWWPASDFSTQYHFVVKHVE